MTSVCRCISCIDVSFFAGSQSATMKVPPAKKKKKNTKLSYLKHGLLGRNELYRWIASRS